MPTHQPTHAAYAPPSPQSVLASEVGDNTMSWDDLRNIVLPLPAFLAANSHPKLIDPDSIYEGSDPHRANRKVRLCYRLAPQVLYEETSLEQPLAALLRASRRGHTTRSWPLRITVEQVCNTTLTYDGAWLALVISTAHGVEREACVRHVNRLLRVVLRSGYIRPLDRYDCAMLGRVPNGSRT